MSTKFLSRLSDEEIFEFFLKACVEKEVVISLERIERRDDEFVMYVCSAGDLLPMYIYDFCVIENVSFSSEINLNVWRALLYKRFAMKYAKAYFEYLEKVYVL